MSADHTVPEHDNAPPTTKARDNELKNEKENENETVDDDDAALFESLENEDDSSYRTYRVEQLNAEFEKEASRLSNHHSHHPDFSNTTEADPDTTYPTLSNDQSLLDFTTGSHRCVVHFAHPDFARCAVMDDHLRSLASKHYEVRFARVDARDIPFVVEKLNIRVLPYVIGFKDGVAVERVVGFEGLGSGGRQDGVDQFSTIILEKRLLWKGVLVREKFGSSGRGDTTKASRGSDSEDDDDDDDDEEDEDEIDRRKRLTGRTAIRGSNTRRNDDDDDDYDDWD